MLTKPCNNFHFRNDIKPYLTAERVRGLERLLSHRVISLDDPEHRISTCTIPESS